MRGGKFSEPLGGAEEQLALDVELPSSRGTNEAKLGWFDGVDLGRMEGNDGPHFIELVLFKLAALGLHFAELLQSLQQAAGQALFVDGECCDRVFGAAECVGEGECGVRFGVAGVPVVSVFLVTDGEEVVLGGGHAVEAELEVGAGVGELDFDGAYGIECAIASLAPATVVSDGSKYSASS